MQDREKWVGFDFDRTLFKREDGDDIKTYGDPIWKNIELVKTYLVAGEKVKIFTARVAVDKPEDVLFQTELIQGACKQYFGQVLDITCIKDPNCIKIYDDIAVQVVPNSGELVE